MEWYTPFSISFFNNFVKKNLTVAGVLRKNILFSLPIPKINFDPPPQEENDLVFIFKSFIKSTIFQNWKFCQKFNFVSTPCKIIIPLGYSVGVPIWVIQMHLFEGNGAAFKKYPPTH